MRICKIKQILLEQSWSVLARNTALIYTSSKSYTTLAWDIVVPVWRSSTILSLVILSKSHDGTCHKCTIHNNYLIIIMVLFITSGNNLRFLKMTFSDDFWPKNASQKILGGCTPRLLQYVNMWVAKKLTKLHLQGSNYILPIKDLLIKSNNN